MTVDWRRVFERAPGNYLVLDPHLRIVAVSDGYLAATMTERENIVGRGIFDVFPPDPNAPEGARDLQRSLARVIRTTKPHRMQVTHYPIRRPDGSWEERYWQPLNSPVSGENGELEYIVHTVEDVTVALRSRAVKLGGPEFVSTVRKLRMVEHIFSLCISLAALLAGTTYLLHGGTFQMSAIYAELTVLFQSPLAAWVWLAFYVLGAGGIISGLITLRPRSEGIGHALLAAAFAINVVAVASLPALHRILTYAAISIACTVRFVQLVRQ